jgi:hypothetical protein
MRWLPIRFRLWTLFLAIGVLAVGLAVVRWLERKVALNNELRRSYTVVLEDQIVSPNVDGDTTYRGLVPSLRRDLTFAVVELHEADFAGEGEGALDAIEARRALAKVGSLHTIQRIDLTSVPIDEPSLRALTQLPALRALRIGLGSSDRQIRDCLQSLPQLAVLDLSHSQISDETGSLLAQHPELESLDLTQTAIAQRTADALAEMPQLKTLRLDGCPKLSAAAIAQLARSKSLEAISVWDTLCDDEALVALAAIPTLKEVSAFDATRTTSLGVDRLKLLRPDVKVTWRRYDLDVGR